jgi:hypothetical protein
MTRRWRASHQRLASAPQQFQAQGGADRDDGSDFHGQKRKNDSAASCQRSILLSPVLEDWVSVDIKRVNAELAHRGESLLDIGFGFGLKHPQVQTECGCRGLQVLCIRLGVRVCRVHQQGWRNRLRHGIAEQ